MADLIVGPSGNQTNVGDPANCDDKYKSGLISISEDARRELERYPELVLLDYQNKAGPQTQACLAALRQLVGSRFVYGRFAVFATPEAVLMALRGQLLRYNQSNGLDKMKDIISKCPPRLRTTQPATLKAPWATVRASKPRHACISSSAASLMK
ncbi:hypothetical protein NQF86_02875 [Bombella sp. TMW 2.2543]|uniref:Uncharacterized protein n=1 Tax=Bombella pluederhausensis TaxID=2967336 RepID=A0ABT3WEW5_9PROT|nr:hypothetical protein [Bombella pluederhausensis]MCX5617616.1 hypothetical protein [Bombella pluederhausensis]